MTGELIKGQSQGLEPHPLQPKPFPPYTQPPGSEEEGTLPRGMQGYISHIPRKKALIFPFTICTQSETMVVATHIHIYL